MWLLTDAGFNLLLSMTSYKWYYHLVSASRADAAHDTPYKVAGPLCDSGDVYFDIEGGGRLPDYRLLPANVRPGEALALLPRQGGKTFFQVEARHFSPLRDQPEEHRAGRITDGGERAERQPVDEPHQRKDDPAQLEDEAGGRGAPAGILYRL